MRARAATSRVAASSSASSTLDRRLGQLPGDEDLLTVDGHLDRGDEPVVGDAAGEPGGEASGACCRGHTYMITQNLRGYGLDVTDGAVLRTLARTRSLPVTGGRWSPMTPVSHHG